MSTQDIYNCRKVDDRLITGGQPTEEQLREAAREGFTVVINIADFGERNALPDEAGLVRSLGMAYHHIPVAWKNPTAEDFEAFEHLLASLAGEKVLLHCAANFRVTAFYALYAMKRLGWTEERADAFRASVWQGSNHPVWEAFVREMKGRIVREEASTC